MAVATPPTKTHRPRSGRVIAITGPVVDIEFPAGHLPEIYNAVEIQRDGEPLVCEVQQHLGNNWVRTVAMTTTDGLRARHRRRSTPGAPISVPVGPATLGRIFNVLGEPIDNEGPVEAETRYPIHRDRAGLRRAGHRGRDLRDRPQGHRPDRALHARAARSASSAAPASARRSSSRSSSATSPRSTAATRCSPAWASAPAKGNDLLHEMTESGVIGQDRHGLRPDERAAGRAPARRPDRPDHGRVLPRRGPRRPALHRQHLPLHAGGLGGVGAARPHAVAPWATSPTWPPRWASSRSASRPPRRARSRRCRPSTCLPTTTPTRHRRRRSPTSTRRSASSAPWPSRASTRPSTRCRPPAASSTRTSSARSTTTSPARPARPPALPGPAGHHRHPGHRRAVRGRQADRRARPQDAALHDPADVRGRAVHRPRRALRADRGHRARRSRRSWTASTTTCPSRPSSSPAPSTMSASTRRS